MAGILDALFPNADATQAMGLLGAGMMAGNTPGGFQAAMGLLSPENRLKRDLMGAQLENYKSEMAQRAAALERQKQMMELLPKVLNGGGAVPAQNGQLGSGTFGIMPTAPGVPDVPANAGRSGIGGARVEDLAMLHALGGPDLMNYYKAANEGFKRDPGAFYDIPGKGREYIPKVPEGAMFSNGRISSIPGQADFLTQQTLATEAPKTLLSSAANVNLRKNPDGTESPVSSLAENPTLQNVLGGIFNGRANVGAPAGVPPQVPRVPVAPRVQPGDAERAAILQKEYADAQQRLAQAQSDPRSTPDTIRRSQEDITSLEREMKRSGIAYGKTTAQETRDAAVKDATLKVNDSWIKTSYEPTVALGTSSRDLLDTVQITRQAMQNLGTTGWSTPAKAAGAAILSGLGIAPENAKLFAANAETFQSKVMERNWQRLNEAKGPQTEGDSQRALQTWAQLRNTPKANEFMLDMTEAQAMRDQMKARFYQNAMPLARDKGDLSEVDREWQKRAPSLFSLGPMQKWAGGIK